MNRDIELIDCDNQFNPVVPNKHFDVLYICSPSNPTGINYSYEVLKAIVDYAVREGCIIIYDNVYFHFINSGVKSIYDVDGARKCAIELRSFSKHASFTGIRCSSIWLNWRRSTRNSKQFNALYYTSCRRQKRSLKCIW